MYPLETFEKCFWEALSFALFFGAWLWFLLKRRDIWLRWTAAEATFWLCLRMPSRLVNANRRFVESRSFIQWVAGFFFVFLLLCITAGGFYFYFKEKFEQHRQHGAENATILILPATSNQPFNSLRNSRTSTASIPAARMACSL